MVEEPNVAQESRGMPTCDQKTQADSVVATKVFIRRCMRRHTNDRGLANDHMRLVQIAR